MSRNVPKRIATLAEFYDLMDLTAAARREAVCAALSNETPPGGAVDSLARARECLSRRPGEGARRRLLVEEGLGVEADLAYEFDELEKDLIYLRDGEEALLAHLAAIHPGFAAETEALADFLAGHGPDGPWRTVLTDRDGTVNNYCGRYRSSVQPAYNAVFLCRFAAQNARDALILTSAPLRGPGLIDVSVMPMGHFHLAASKGRECLDRQGKRHAKAVPARQQTLLDMLARDVRNLLKKTANAKFGLIGSGFQVKYGQLTVARQDVTRSVPESESEAFLAEVEKLTRALDPKGRDLVIEDTGLDVEIILTVEGTGQDFDKGEAARFLDRELGLGFAEGPVLVCGDTSSDLPMIRAVAELSPAPAAVLVTKNPDLAARLPEACGTGFVVSEPDVLVTALAVSAGGLKTNLAGLSDSKAKGSSGISHDNGRSA